MFEFSDFVGAPGAPSSPYGIFLPDVCMGLIGSGPGRGGRGRHAGPSFASDLNTSTRPRIAQDNDHPEPVRDDLPRHRNNPRGSCTNTRHFQLIGTEQQNDYHGLVINNPAGPVYRHDLIGFGGQATAGAPPGETFNFGLSGGGGSHRTERVYVNANNTGGGVTQESGASGVWRDVTVEYSPLPRRPCSINASRWTPHRVVLGPRGPRRENS